MSKRAPPIEVRAGKRAPLGMSAAQFLERYWQKHPVLIRGAFPDFVCPIAPNDLAGLACEPMALSRLVVHQARGDRWRVRSGPFTARDFARLPRRDWTLLVQDCDKLLAEIDALRARLALRDRVAVEEEVRALLKQSELAQSLSLQREAQLLLAQTLLAQGRRGEAEAALVEVDALLAQAPDAEPASHRPAGLDEPPDRGDARDVSDAVREGDGAAIHAQAGRNSRGAGVVGVRRQQPAQRCAAGVRAPREYLRLLREMAQQFAPGTHEVPVLGDSNVQQPQGGLTLAQVGRVALVVSEPDHEDHDRHERDRHQRQEPESER